MATASAADSDTTALANVCNGSSTPPRNGFHQGFPPRASSSNTLSSMGCENISVGTKADPVCLDPQMTKESMSASELTFSVFPPEFSLIDSDIDVSPSTGTASSSIPVGAGAGNSGLAHLSMKQLFAISSTKPSTTGGANGDTGIIANPQVLQSECNNTAAETSSHCSSEAVLADLQQKSEMINEFVTMQTTSRLGRSTQRWVVDKSSNNNVVRLVVGCIPILKDGRVVLVSASKKNEWILPKGGWELDESMEESAIRETFEEAGVIGVLGPKLSEVMYETRKARKRRLAEVVASNTTSNTTKGGTNGSVEPMTCTATDCSANDDQFSSGWSVVSQLSEDDQIFPASAEINNKGVDSHPHHRHQQISLHHNAEVNVNVNLTVVDQDPAGDPLPLVRNVSKTNNNNNITNTNKIHVSFQEGGMEPSASETGRPPIGNANLPEQHLEANTSSFMPILGCSGGKPPAENDSDPTANNLSIKMSSIQKPVQTTHNSAATPTTADFDSTNTSLIASISTNNTNLNPETDSDNEKKYTHVKLALFPLYVTEVKDKWPENRRLRRAMSINEAIQRLHKRPEMRAILTELRDKGLHRI